MEQTVRLKMYDLFKSSEQFVAALVEHRDLTFEFKEELKKNFSKKFASRVYLSQQYIAQIFDLFFDIASEELAREK